MIVKYLNESFICLGKMKIRKEQPIFLKNYSTLINIKKVKDIAKHIQILTPKQMLQRFPIALAQVKGGNTFENVPNEIRQIIYSSYLTKEITRKVCNKMNLTL